MTKQEKAERIGQAITLLFEVPSSGDTGYQFDMSEMKMVYGILLQSCGLIEMSEEASQRAVAHMKGKIKV